MALRTIAIGGRAIGGGVPVFVIAEAGVNHNGDLAMAHRLIDEAAQAGADAVKFQTFVASEIVVPELKKARYQLRSRGADDTQLSMLRALELDADAHAALFAHCRERGIMFLSTPYDEPSVELLDRLDVPAFKVASTDTTNPPFLRLLARKGRPIVLSSGMCSLEEVRQATDLLRSEQVRDLALLQCTSQYPTPPAETNLRVIHVLEAAFDCPVGFSDHTEGTGVAPLAVAAGACIIEKHFTLDRGLPGPDHAASLDPGGLAELVRVIRQAEALLGDGLKRVMPCEVENKPVMQKRIVARTPLVVGVPIEEAGLCAKRAPIGLPASDWDQVIGRYPRRHVALGEPVTADVLGWNRSESSS